MPNKYLSILLLNFITVYLCSAQDTIVTRSGNRIVCKVNRVGDNVNFRYWGDTAKQKYKINTYLVQYIKFSNGQKEFYNFPWDKKDVDVVTIFPALPKPSVSIFVGPSIPIGVYHSSVTYPGDAPQNNISGFADNGFILYFVGDFPVSKNGWDLFVQAGYIAQNVNIGSLLYAFQTANYYYPFAVGEIQSYSSGSNYYYKLYPILFGVGKQFKIGAYSIGLRAMIGDLIINIPTMEGNVTISGYNSVGGPVREATNNFLLNAPLQHLSAYSGGLTIGRKLSKCLKINVTADYLGANSEYYTKVLIKNQALIYAQKMQIVEND